MVAMLKLPSPLAGLKVLDFTRILAGPFCTMLLGDMGAEVIKVEKCGTGDDTRSWQPPSVKGQSCYFVSLNRNKKSICLNLQHREGRKIALALAEKSDVVVENFIPGTMRRLGLDYETLRSLNSRLIYCSITGYGQTGPYSARGGYDVAVSAIGGLMSITGPQDGDPCKAGVALVDVITGLHTKSAILAALLQRNQTNVGQRIDANLLASQISSLINIGSNVMNTSATTARWGTAHESIVPYQAFKTNDGFFMIGAGNDKQFQELCKLLNASTLATDNRFSSNPSRVAHREILIEELSNIFMSQNNDHWVQLFTGSKLPNGPVSSVADALANEQVKHLGLQQTLSHPKYGDVEVIGPAVEFSGSTVKCRSAPPILGEHTAEVLSTVLNYSSDNINQLVDQGVVQVSLP